MQALETPQVAAVIVQDGEGGRLVAKYFDREAFGDKTVQAEFEKKLYKKSRNGTTVRSESEILLLDGMTVVYKLGTDVGFFVVGDGEENELILVAVLDALHDALSSLLKGAMDGRSILNHLELLLLTIDELVEGGIPFELDPRAIESRVMLRGAVPDSISSYQVCVRQRGPAATSCRRRSVDGWLPCALPAIASPPDPRHRQQYRNILQEMTIGQLADKARDKLAKQFAK